MAVFGLQVDFINKLLREYFGITCPNLTQPTIFVGLGLTQQGASINTEDFNEVFAGRPLGNYKRARVVFGRANDMMISNINEITFQTASEDWTTGTQRVEMLGIYNTLDYENKITKELIKPQVVLNLARFETVVKGETLVLAPNSIVLRLADI